MIWTREGLLDGSVGSSVNCILPCSLDILSQTAVHIQGTKLRLFSTKLHWNKTAQTIV
jgi:hypothetical protein